MKNSLFVYFLHSFKIMGKKTFWWNWFTIDTVIDCSIYTIYIIIITSHLLLIEINYLINFNVVLYLNELYCKRSHSKSKEWLTWNQSNVSEWRNLSVTWQYWNIVESGVKHHKLKPCYTVANSRSAFISSQISDALRW
jgi:hypothetical protein